MFFSLIRASNQLSPKTKVVVLIVLYNFYFGQISRSNVKFGVLDGQSQLKTTRSRSTVTSLFWSVHRRARRSRRHASAGVDPRSPRRCADTSLSLSPEPCPFFLLFSFLTRAGRAELQQSHRRPPCRPSSPSCLDSPRPEPSNLALHLLHPSSSPISSSPGRIRRPRRRPPLELRRSSALTRRAPSPVHLLTNREHGELPRALLLLPDRFPP